MKKSIILISSALLLIAGCAKEQLAEPAVQNEYDGPVTIVGATYEQYAPEGGTKASFDANGVFGWESSDAALFELEGDNNWTNASAQITENKLYCTFTILGTLSTDMVAVLPSDLSPVRYTAESTNDGLKVTIPASRTWVKDQSYATMIGFGTANGQSYKFSHLCGLAKVTVNGVPAGARKFVFKTKGFKINGVFEAGKINTSGGQTISTAAANSAATATDDFTEDEETYSLTFTSDDISSTNGVMEFNVPLPCGTYSNGFAFCFKDENNNEIYNFAGSASKEIKRTKRIILPTINISGGGGEGSQTIQNVPADHNGDFYLADAKNVLVNIPSGDNPEKTINFKYYGTKPEKLEIHVVGEATPGTYEGNISGNLSETHVDFTQGEIANVEMTTSASTFEIVQPAKISNKLTVKGGNVKVKGAQVAAIEVAANAVASEETKAPVQIVVDKANAQQFTAPAVTAKANVIVAPAEGVEVKVTAEGQAKVANGGEGTVKDNNNQPINTKAAAQINSIKYITLADAIAAVKNNEQIDIIAEEISATVIPAGSKTFTIDLGKKDVTVVGPAVGSSQTKNQAFQINKGNTITIKNGTIKCDNTGDIFRFVIQNYADLTLEDVIVDGTNLKINGKTDAYTVSSNFGTITFAGNTTVKASTVEGVDSYAIDLYDYSSQSEYPTPAVGVWNSDGSVDGIINIGGGKLTVSKTLKLNKPIKVYKGDKGEASNLIVNANIIPVDGWTSANNGGDALVVVKRGGNLSIEGTGKISYNNQTGVYAAAKVTEKGESSTGDVAKLSVGGSVTLEGYYYGIVGNGDRRDTEITVNGGTIKGVKENDCTGIYHPQKGKLTINGGTIIGSTGIYVKSGDVEASISAGTIKGVGTDCNAYDPAREGDGCDPTGDALVIDNCGYPGGAPTVEIKGGTFISDHYKAVASCAKTGYPIVTGFIKGGTFSKEPDAKYIDPAYTVKKEGEYYKVVELPAGALKGYFSVSPTKKVHFSKGNLTYNVSTTTWAFYEHQYDCATGYDANLISLFTWGYNENTSIVPNGKDYVTGHTKDGESFSASEDWGSQIGDGKTWRTLTTAEWVYLFDTREASTVSGTSNARYAKATVGSKSGIILLPDKYEHPSGVAALTNINTSDAGYTANSYDVTTWAAMEAAGAVFLPAAYYRNGNKVNYGNTFGSYWSSTYCSVTINEKGQEHHAYCVEFDSTSSNVDPDNNYLDPEYIDNCDYGCSVRLVTESN